MPIAVLLVTLIGLTVAGYYMGRSRAVAVGGHGARHLNSLPGYYGLYVAAWCGIPAVSVVVLWLALEPEIIRALLVATLPDVAGTWSDGTMALMLNDIRNLAGGNIVSRDVDPELRTAAEYYAFLRNTGFAAMAVVALVIAAGGLAYGRRAIHPDLRARNRVESVLMVFLIISSTVAILVTIGIVLSLLFEAIRFFQRVSPVEFLFGLEWSPQTALRADQVGSSGKFGSIPLLMGTALISFIAMCVAVPVGLLSAIYMAEYAPPRVRSAVKPALEILAGIPTVVYGFFAALTMAPFLRDWGSQIGLSISSESALAAGLVMGIMIIPFISSISDDVITAVPQSMREGSLGLGATKSETIRRVIIPAALPGIVGGVLLAVSRAIGETMIVVMAAGLAANLTVNPLQAVTTVTVQIVTLLVGDQEFDSAKTLAAFALGLVLFFVTLALNIVALTVVKKYREQYE